MPHRLHRIPNLAQFQRSVSYRVLIAILYTATTCRSTLSSPVKFLNTTFSNSSIDQQYPMLHNLHYWISHKNCVEIFYIVNELIALPPHILNIQSYQKIIWELPVNFFFDFYGSSPRKTIFFFILNKKKKNQILIKFHNRSVLKNMKNVCWKILIVSRFFFLNVKMSWLAMVKKCFLIRKVQNRVHSIR